ncbi:hypothetical protein [Streptomyces coerulescens]|uniref:Uncharacterized protein n=1 Tax=Streptomyces coerulescens TaxID=29304 RepID=A0ABW0D0Y9_STRCD
MAVNLYGSARSVDIRVCASPVLPHGHYAITITSPTKGWVTPDRFVVRGGTKEESIQTLDGAQVPFSPAAEGAVCSSI